MQKKSGLFAVILGLSLFPVMGQSAEPKMINCKPFQDTKYFVCEKENLVKKPLFVPPNTTPVATVKGEWNLKIEPPERLSPSVPDVMFSSHRVEIRYWVESGAMAGKKIKDHTPEPFKLRVVPNVEIGQEYFPCFSGAVTLWFENGQSFIVSDVKNDDGKDGFDRVCRGDPDNTMISDISINTPYAEKRDREYEFAKLLINHRIVAISSGKRSILLDYPEDDPAVQKFRELIQPDGDLYYNLKYYHDYELKIEREGKDSE
ncbi:hypothetical protein FAI40_04560 [Acetobacteraceae bacterium]|nr:hypothetical protein FAI40_04560 [Acetobacteraceae bacterium]